MVEKDIFNEIEVFHGQRIAKLKNNETPKPFSEGGKTVLHLIPLDSFSDPKNYDISAFQKQIDTLLKPMFVKNMAHTQDYNFDGLIDFIQGADGNCLSYVQLYRDGIVEAVEGFCFGSERKDIPIYSLEQEIILNTEYYLSLQKEMGIEPPVICYLALLGVEGHSIAVKSIDTHFLNIHPFDREDLILPKIVIEKFEINEAEMFRVSFDRIWNACGYPRSLQYNENGDFKAK